MLVVGFRDYFINFVHSDGRVGFAPRTGLLNTNLSGIMVKIKLGKHTVEMYDTIDELPIVRFHKYQKLLLVDAGIGADITAFDRRIEKTKRFLSLGKTEQAAQELENLRQSVYLIQNGLSPKMRAFAALVTRLDGKPCDEITDDALEKISAALADVPANEFAAQLDAVKKKIEQDLTLYFPALFDDSEVKEYYDLLRKRSLAMLDAIIAGKSSPAEVPEVEKLTTALITYSNPQTFTGSAGVEVQFDKQFENLCLALSEQLHIDPKKYTVLEFYNAFEFAKERAKKAENAQKKRFKND